VNVYATCPGTARLAAVSRRAAPFSAVLFLPTIALFAASNGRAQEAAGARGEAEDPAVSAPAVGVGATSGVTSAGASQLAQDVPGLRGDPVEWDPAWPEFGTGEYIAGAIGIAALIAGRVLPLPTAHWRGGIGLGINLDEGARRALRLQKPASRRWARDGSDVGITINESWPFFDALVVAGWYRDSPHVAVQQALISAEVVAVTAGVQGLVSYAASRERPYGRECGAELNGLTRDCVGRDRYYSFYSGHSSQSFAAAAVNCMHHSYVPLYGGGAADRWACVGTFGVAATTALLRVATDVHYASDVLLGALIGTTTGLLLPWALHYRHGGVKRAAAGSDASSSDSPSVLVLPSLGAGYGGLYGVVTF
jgi:membrane-associated phospholipid phosphatase